MDSLIYKAGFPGSVYAGKDSLQKIEDIIQEHCTERVVVLIDQAVETMPEIRQMCTALGDKLAGVVDDIPAEPACHSIKGICDRVLALDGEMIIAIGGGSVMDMAKVVASAVTNKAYAEAGFMTPELITEKPVPTVMVPTTAGTGAEATPNAVFLVPKQELKVGVVSNTFVASYVILDPVMTSGMPPQLTASTGIDALCHGIESYLSVLANPISKAFSLKAVALIGSGIEKAYHDGTDLEAREKMLLGSFFAGLCLSSSSTVAVHALSYPLGGKYHIPHGVANAILLPWVLRANLSHCREAYCELAEAMLPQKQLEAMESVPEGFVTYIFELCRNLGIPGDLTRFGLKKGDINDLADRAMEVDRLLSKNPKKLSREEIRAVYEALL